MKNHCRGGGLPQVAECLPPGSEFKPQYKVEDREWDKKTVWIRAINKSVGTELSTGMMW
jgi:hypothetical protein